MFGPLVQLEVKGVSWPEPRYSGDRERAEGDVHGNPTAVTPKIASEVESGSLEVLYGEFGVPAQGLYKIARSIRESPMPA